MRLIAQIWVFPLILLLEVLPRQFHNSDWVRYALKTMTVGYLYAHADTMALTSRNSGSVRTRTVAYTLYNMSLQAASVIGSQIYRTDDQPYYYRGNKMLLGVLIWKIIAFVAAKVYYVVRNKRRDQIWWNMSRVEILNYLATTNDQGNRRVNFRFAS